ncbi:UDP-N-acetylmuramoyl-tripeptide--D-alanyl-D-alanine ligase [Actinomadura sp. NEAU-AAG7]|uniref:UDP-N-acetylmuramoyl-tripeptide--D-alanyl-D- alanine ligase n=1 Tax=Actinomadura sp. NEAU-AAG7 TaxID=2839640 RepID=UPI001BE475F6|nr:UDP-N-acetylmuramoyl-tripeptide--D-alanyl-D-alanine ligase [Actinomadura sp. NEAU-AAG7]MBT2207948.1 UDP-N-acetylmuramoyl-tripeptide--D-alanyl-D-alanine ligase [Actinomadura sp. NEAU-AAG7]
MIPLTLHEIALAVGGTVHGAPAPGPTVTGPVVIDARDVTPGALFVAVAGERGDGHDLAARAYAFGACAVLGTRAVEGPCVVVDEVVSALTDLAMFVRDMLDLVVIGVTGSVGKTTTKDLLAQILEREAPTVATAGSDGNEIGLPLTILRADRWTRYLVLEMGAARQGDITHLAWVARPQFGLVLNIGPAHLLTLGGIIGVARAKAELVRALPPAGEGGLAFLNADDAAVASMAGATSAGVVSYGRDAEASVRAGGVTVDGEGRASFILHTPSGAAAVRLGLPGEHQVGNALAAASVADVLGVTTRRIAARLSAAAPRSPNRFQLVERADGITVIDDACHANPVSMRAALRTLATMSAGRRTIAVLGEMTGQAGDAARHHAAVGRLAAELGVAILVVVGTGEGPDALSEAARRAGVATHALPRRREAVALLRSLLRPADVVLVKASGEIGLSAVATALWNPRS